MNKFREYIISHPVIYVTRDIERALGVLPQNGYHIITNSTKYSEFIKHNYPLNVFTIKSDIVLDTSSLLENEQVKNYINEIIEKNNKTSLLVFKNTNKIEEICEKQNWKLLNPKAKLSERIENKIEVVDWLGKLAEYLPAFEIIETKKIKWSKEPFILQWARSHTGDGTIFVDSENKLNELKEKFPDRPARISPYIKGPVFTSNISVSNEKIWFGNISYQITGILPYTESVFSTVGNDWSITHSLLTESRITEYEKMAEKIAEKMRDSGWRGLFGIDVIYDIERDELKLLEINARQPASTTFESELQNENSLMGIDGISIFEAHLISLLGLKTEKGLIQTNDGSQIIQRLTNSISNKLKDGKYDFHKTAEKIRGADFRVIEYPIGKENSDFLRIQCSRGIMKNHNELNERGIHITELLSLENDTR